MADPAGRRYRARNLRRARVRKSVRGTADRPRISVYRSERHIYAQVISDETGETLLSASTMAPDVRSHLKKTTDVAAARTVGEYIGKRCIEKGIKSAVFDRNGFLYHGRVAAVADGARAAGLRI